jgi:hypothetical protein
MINLGSWFQSPYSPDSKGCFWAIKVGSMRWSKATHLMMVEETERGEERERIQRYAPKATPFRQVPFSILIAQQNYEPINELIH